VATTPADALDPIAVSGPERCVVGFVGFPTPFAAHATGILRRCGVEPVEFAELFSVCRVMQTLSMSAVVLDTHSLQLEHGSRPLEHLIALIASSAHGPASPTRLIVVTSTAMPPNLKHAFVSVDATFLPARRRTYREIAVVVRRLCDLPGRCCEGQ
jgi:hypothetical protein